MKFIDEARFEVVAGDGGPGCVSFFRAKGIPRGGPDGGDGGNGGSVYFRADRSLNTLVELRYRKKLRAGGGEPGMGSQCNGRAGKDIVIRVPVGTLIYDAQTEELLADLNEHDQKARVAKGGRGGLGNMNFATSVRRAPQFAQPGTEGEIKMIRLELRLLADIGLIGFPNVGKSTLISRISAARPKVADYPFTTLVPQLGVVQYDHKCSFVVADIPGLIEGASQGAGLGFQFLRHVSRVKALVHILAFDFADTRDPLKDYEIIRQELKAYSKELAKKPEVIVLNKCELTDSKELVQQVKKMAQKKKKKFFAISAVTGEGVSELLDHLASMNALDAVK